MKTKLSIESWLHDVGLHFSPTASAVLAAEIDRLRERLEMWPVDKNGDLDKSQPMLNESCDGIACRDETIRQLQHQVDDLRELVKISEDCARKHQERADKAWDGR